MTSSIDLRKEGWQCSPHCVTCRIAPSLLAADLANLAAEARSVLAGGADELQHLLPAAEVVDLDLLHADVLRRVGRVTEDDLLLGDRDGGRGELRGARVVGERLLATQKMPRAPL